MSVTAGFGRFGGSPDEYRSGIEWLQP
jgi:hypothetical protein